MFLAFAALLLAGVDEYARGLELYKAGNHREAARSFENVTRNRPAFAPGWKALGVIRTAEGNYALALETFKRACELQPDLPDACYYLGRTLFELNRYEASLAALDQAVKAERSPGRPHLWRALSLEALGRRTEAEQAFKTAIQLTRPGTAADDDPRIGYGVFLMRQGRISDALKVLAPAAGDHQDNSRALLQFGRALFEEGRPAEALEALDRAAKLDPYSAQAALLLGRVLMHLGRRDAALVQLERGRMLEMSASQRGSSTSIY